MRFTLYSTLCVVSRAPRVRRERWLQVLDGMRRQRAAYVFDKASQASSISSRGSLGTSGGNEQIARGWIIASRERLIVLMGTVERAVVDLSIHVVAVAIEYVHPRAHARWIYVENARTVVNCGGCARVGICRAPCSPDGPRALQAARARTQINRARDAAIASDGPAAFASVHHGLAATDGRSCCAWRRVSCGRGGLPPTS